MIGAAGRALVTEALRPLLAATCALAAVGLLLVLGQALATAAVTPGPAGALRLALGLLPVVTAIALPVGLLFGLVASARAWREGGDWRALATAGVGARAVVPAVLLYGLGLALIVAGLTHVLEPLGRTDARQTLARAAGDLRMQPGRPLAVGDALVHAQAVTGPLLGDVLIAGGRTAVAARTGLLGGAGIVSLTDGQAVSLGDDGAVSWRLDFLRAELRLDVQTPRVELTQRTDAELAALIGRLEVQGQPATAQRLALARRTALPASLPLLALLAVPLGARGARPGAAATLVVLGWWSVLRVADQAATSCGPLLAAWAPVLAVGVAAAIAWASWRDR